MSSLARVCCRKCVGMRNRWVGASKPEHESETRDQLHLCAISDTKLMHFRHPSIGLGNQLVSCLGLGQSVLCPVLCAVVSLADPERGPAALSLSAGSNQCASTVRPHKAGALWFARIKVALLCAGRGGPEPGLSARRATTTSARPTILGPLLRGSD